MKIKKCKIKLLTAYFDANNVDVTDKPIVAYVISNLNNYPDSQHAIIDLGYTYLIIIDNIGGSKNFDIIEEINDIDNLINQDKQVFVKSNICSIRDIIGQNIKGLHIQF